MTRQVRITREQARRMGLGCGAAAPQKPQDASGDEIAFSGGSREGYASHWLETPCPCPICGEISHRYYQKFDGLKVGDPMCEACTDAKRTRKKKRRSGG